MAYQCERMPFQVVRFRHMRKRKEPAVKKEKKMVSHAAKAGKLVRK